MVAFGFLGQQGWVCLFGSLSAGIALPLPTPCHLLVLPQGARSCYLQRLSSKQACKHMLGSRWCQWDWSMLLITHSGGLLKCGWDAGLVHQMCSWEAWKSPRCCHNYKLQSCWTCVIYILLCSGGRHHREKGCEIASHCLNVATSVLELGSSAESRTVRGINNSCSYKTSLAYLLLGKICVTFVAVEPLLIFVKNYCCVLMLLVLGIGL